MNDFVNIIFNDIEINFIIISFDNGSIENSNKQSI